MQKNEPGMRLFHESVVDKDAQRIIFLDGPSVLDPRVCRENVQAVDLIRRSLEQLATEGFIEDAPGDTLARLLWGSFLEAGLCITYAADAEKVQREMARGLEYLFESLRTKPRS